MRLAILDLHRGGGHHSTYVRAVLCEARRRQWESTVVLSREAVEHPSFQLISNMLDSGCRLVTIDDLTPQSRFENKPWLSQQVHRYAEAQRAYAETCKYGGVPDAVFYPDCDGWYAAGALFGSPTKKTQSAAVIFSIRYHRKALGIDSNISRVNARFQKRLFETFLRRNAVDSVFVSDETLINHHQFQAKLCRARLRYLPEIADMPPLLDKNEARDRLRLPVGKHIVLCYGLLSRRKGIAELVNALQSSNCPDEISVLLAGEADEDIVNLMASYSARSLRTQGRLFWKTGFLSDEQTRLAFSAADSAWLGYRQFGNPSGVLWQATRAHLPIIGCADGLIGHWTKTHELGPVIDPSDVEAVANALRLLATDDNLRAKWVANCRQESESHSPENFGRQVCSVFQQESQ